MKKIILITLIVTFTFFLSFILDKTLGLLGYPSDTPIIYMHPKNLKQYRKNIEFEYLFTTNDQGIRYREIPLTKPENELRIFLLGDSFTEGYGVPLEMTFGSLLENYFSKKQGQHVSFINGGLSGAGPLEYLKVFLKVGVNYNLNGILICLFANDVSDMQVSDTPKDIQKSFKKRHRIKKLLHNLYPRTYTMISKLIDRYAYKSKTETSDFISLISKRALEIGIPRQKIERWKQKLPNDLVLAVNKGEFNGRILSFGLLNPDVWVDTFDLDTERAKNKYRSMIVCLEEIIKIAEKKGIEVAIVYIPWGLQYDPNTHKSSNIWIKTGTYVRKSWLTEKTVMQKRFEQWVSEKKLPFLDLTPIFRREIKISGPLNYKLDGHWNSDGHKIASAAISKWMEENHIFSFIEYD